MTATTGVAAKKVKRFDMWWVNLDPTLGREINKQRPCVVVSPDVMNDRLQTVLVVPLTSGGFGFPARLAVTLKGKAGFLPVDQMRAVDKQRLVDCPGILPARFQRSLLALLQEVFAE